MSNQTKGIEIECRLIITNNGFNLETMESKERYVLNRSKLQGGAPYYLSKVAPVKEFISGMFMNKETMQYKGVHIDGSKYVITMLPEENKAIIAIVLQNAIKKAA